MKNYIRTLDDYIFTKEKYENTMEHILHSPILKESDDLFDLIEEGDMVDLNGIEKNHSYVINTYVIVRYTPDIGYFIKEFGDYSYDKETGKTYMLDCYYDAKDYIKDCCKEWYIKRDNNFILVAKKEDGKWKVI